jgi:hypothetical protein
LEGEDIPERAAISFGSWEHVIGGGFVGASAVKAEAAGRSRRPNAECVEETGLLDDRAVF